MGRGPRATSAGGVNFAELSWLSAQIVVGLAVTRDGLPVRSWVFFGATNDVTTIARVKEDLRGCGSAGASSSATPV